ncbi:MAG: hypothetical protein AB1299_05910 [Thermoproteota archaeon]|jgi:tRNA-binding EMAP/Myf-like protein|nr:hypothetical protein [Candidatus Nitrosotenuis sp.]
MTQKQNIVIMAAIIGAVAVGLVGAYFLPAQSTLTTIPTTSEEQAKYDAVDVAQKYIVTSPTFAFDGMHDTLDVVDVAVMESHPVQYRVKIAFDSSHTGFGDRTDQILAEVITPHKMDIIVSEGIVVSAVTDGVWDELNHQYVLKNPNDKLTSHDDPLTQFDGQVSDYSSLVEAIKSRGVLVEPVDELDDSPFSTTTKVISVGGADVQVYEFHSESDAGTASLTVSEDGTEIGTSIIQWIDVPHFYTKGKIIVLYVGQNPEITNLLESLLGTQFAGM